MAARRTDKPFVTTYHGAYNSAGPLKNAYNSVMARGDIVVANSQFTARLIAKAGKLGRKPKLTPQQKHEALSRRTAGETLMDIARTYNVSFATISRLKP